MEKAFRPKTFKRALRILQKVAKTFLAKTFNQKFLNKILAANLIKLYILLWLRNHINRFLKEPKQEQ